MAHRSNMELGSFLRTKTAKAVAGGTCPSDEYYGSMADGMVTLASFGDSVDADTQALIAEKAAAIIDGSFAPFTGPVTDQDGNEVVAAECTPRTSATCSA